jgi:uncharacterized membrane protein YccC
MLDLSQLDLGSNVAILIATAVLLWRTKELERRMEKLEDRYNEHMEDMFP